MNFMESGKFTDEDVERAIRYAKRRIDRYTGTSWGNITTPGYDPFTTTIRHRGGCLRLEDEEGRRILFVRTIDDVDLDGATVETADWHADNIGRIESDTSLQAGVYKIIGTAGKEDSPNTDIEWAARIIATDHLLTDNSKVPDRAIEQESQFGPLKLAQPTMRKTTGIPRVDRALMDYRHRRGPVF